MKEIEHAARSALSVADTAARSAIATFGSNTLSNADFTIFSAARSALSAVHAGADSVGFGAFGAVHAAAESAADPTAYSAEYLDANTAIGGTHNSVFETTLWPSGASVDALFSAWETFAARPDPDGIWTFWRSWYRGMLAGTPMDWDLQLQVAKIEDAIWDAGPEAVAREIVRVEAEFLRNKLPLAETVEINPDTGQFRVVPISVKNAPLVGALLGSVQDALEDAVQGNNGLNDRSREVRVLTRTIDRYGNDPQRIEMNFTSVAIGLRRQIHETNELSNSEDNLSLLETVEEGVRGLRATHAEVAANRQLLALQVFNEFSDADRAKLAEAQPILVALSEDTMADDFAEDVPALINDALGPIPDGAPALPGADAATRIFNRTSQMALIWNNTMDAASDWHDRREHKAARLGMTVVGIGSLLYWIVQIGLKAFGVY
jgi:hypothetical protein